MLSCPFPHPLPPSCREPEPGRLQNSPPGGRALTAPPPAQVPTSLCPCPYSMTDPQRGSGPTLPCSVAAPGVQTPTLLLLLAQAKGLVALSTWPTGLPSGALCPVVSHGPGCLLLLGGLALTSADSVLGPPKGGIGSRSGPHTQKRLSERVCTEGTLHTCCEGGGMALLGREAGGTGELFLVPS